MLFVFALFIGSLALPIAGFQDLLPSMLRSRDGNVAHYSRQVGKYAKRIEDAHDKEVKMLNAGKQLEASGKLTLHSLKNPQTRSELHAIGLIENPVIEKTAFNAIEHLEGLKAKSLEKLYKFRSNDVNIQHYLNEKRKFFLLISSAPTQELKTYYYAKFEESFGKLVHYWLKNPEARAMLRENGVL